MPGPGPVANDPAPQTRRVETGYGKSSDPPFRWFVAGRCLASHPPVKGGNSRLQDLDFVKDAPIRGRQTNLSVSHEALGFETHPDGTPMATLHVEGHGKVIEKLARIPHVGLQQEGLIVSGGTQPC